MDLSRRQLLKGSLISASALALPQLTMALGSGAKYDYHITAEPGLFDIVPGGTTPGLGFNSQFPAPVIRCRQGQEVAIKFTNKLDEPTTIHWHGLRIPIEMDGVPFLSQPPIQPGESFIYRFTPPDAGTFWYHPHMNSLVQLGKGLTGVIIVEETEALPFDADVVIGLKDWRLNQDGSFLPLSIPRNAARGGTLGNVKTINGMIKPVIEVPAGGAIRARFANMDNSRTYGLSFKDYPAVVLAEDGNAIEAPYPLVKRKTGSGMRLDVGFIAPSNVGDEVIVYDQKGRRGYYEICRFRCIEGSKKPATKIPKLPVNPIKAPDLSKAKKINLVFEWAGALSPTKKDGSVDHVFWTINKRAWEGMMGGKIPAPIATLELGKSYIINLHNATPHHHPIHLHGHTFTVIKSNKRPITPYHTDTILLAKNERAQIAFVADNPGRWMFHCHVVEHFKTGLMGYITVA
ncbi:FtsP/CotA-like multicopper oxidase with cupredoxin domain [Sinobacterium caligoides]|uniref:FtsP/CotA-like multicopper oxidase with cupredoxin domain n=1 Tax=Sinobacterium caligoides TaxID=933926 RepID=A0A3N2DJH5_9GAMM|nr:multicopper oxidase family protein [Sinobacterium caligoides]ROR99953.1 FtsP/CotA-like multicopper oxidase with cupredoxin domain [Sinobacterium caligoides]